MTSDLVRSIANLTATERRAVIVSAAEARDRRQSAADSRLAAFWAEVAALAADVDADQAATLRRIEDDVLGLGEG